MGLQLYADELTKTIISTDESGRGCLALPVVASAVILNPDADPIIHPLLNDSKQMSSKNRQIVKEYAEDNMLSAVGIVDVDEIDRVNILNASHKAMHLAIEQLCELIQPELIVVDGDKFRPFYITLQDGIKAKVPHVCVPKADGIYAGVAYASVIAKETRDALVQEACDAHEHLARIYQMDKNKGYPSAAHREALQTHGITQFHRRTFSPCSNLKEFEASSGL